MLPKSLILSIFCCLLLCGCAYHSGNNSVLSSLPETVYVAPVCNDSIAPQMQAVLSAQIRKNLSQCPGIKLVENPTTADAVLTVNVVHFGQSAATRMSDDSVRAKTFSINVRANCSLLDNKSGKYFLRNYAVEASMDIRAEGDYQHRKSQAISQLTLKLAEKIGDAVCNPW
jgi:hypothetical protein